MEQIYLDSIKCVSGDAYEIIASIFHTILFNRAVGTVKPKDHKIEGYEICYVSVSDQGINERLSTEIKKFVKKLNASESKAGEFKLHFTKPVMWSFSSQTWEEWILEIKIIEQQLQQEEESNNENFGKGIREQVKKIFKKIITHVNFTLSNQDYFPQIKDSENPIPFKFKFETTIL
ncbi:hypothetical protein M0813_14199 [Anaeramoeba flamelloides]|uniref:Autophagy-related protein 101 n=1 Tax=Anaeramoeba flamelloides TaxID=1746091 RepID=A0AAV7ZU82_9EUKA|nr:hypothetical protein M0812_10706 [Anaeramoeba flamelloides]KAJ6252348.1 hypothetical protein M0813_14199 [Anaeramoeba flamelloides]